ncbi:hypothetical protein ABTX35_42030, partial [Streptomyces sp. NPDC096080]
LRTVSRSSGSARCEPTPKTRHSQVADGASEAVLALLGGPPPVRAAVGVTGLPSGAPVEVSLVLATAGPH